MNLSDYTAKLAYIRLQCPEHPNLERLERGMSAINNILIDKVYDSIDTEQIPERQTVVKNIDDNIIRMYDINLRKLFVQRARLSNTFHISKSDMEDIDISQNIEAIQAQIASVMSAKSYYIEKKEIKIEEQTNLYEVPSNSFDLVAKHKSVMSSLSRLTKELATMNRKDQPARYQQKDATLMRLATHKKILEQAIEKAKKNE